jgi:hypothetical protein
LHEFGFDNLPAPNPMVRGDKAFVAGYRFGLTAASGLEGWLPENGW